MSWNYRIMKRVFPPVAGKKQAPVYGLHEVYYIDGKVDGWTTDSMIGYFESPEELKETIAMMLRDANTVREVLDYDAKPTKKKGK
jgi:hypothetical protein